MERKDEPSRSVVKASSSTERAAQTIGDTIIAVLDRLAGKKSDIKLSFEDLTFDTGMFKARVNGAVVLDVLYAQEA